MSKIMTLALSLCLCVFMTQYTQAAASGQESPLGKNPERTEAIINEAAQTAGLTAAFGNPGWMMETLPAQADVLVEFPNGPIPDLAAAEFGLLACARLAEADPALQKVGLTVTSPTPDGRLRVYGTAIFNGNLEALAWENTGLTLDRAAGPKIAGASPRVDQPGQIMPVPGQVPPVEEEIMEEVIIVGPDGGPTPGFQPQIARPDGPKPQFGQPMLQPKGQGRPGFPQTLPPMTQKPGDCPYLEGKTAPRPPMPPMARPLPPAGPPQIDCPYLQGLARQPQPGEPGCPYLQSLGPRAGQPPMPAPQNFAGTNCPYLQGLNLQNPQTLQAAENNPALASYAVNAQTLLNDTAAETGIQDLFGNPIVYMDAQDKNVELMVQFRNGPMPIEAARFYGNDACRNLARAWVVKGLGVRRLTITVTSLLPQGGMMIYGTAIYDGNLEEIAWRDFGVAVGPENMQSPFPPGPQPMPNAGVQGMRPTLPAQPGRIQRKPIRVMPGPAQPAPPAPGAQQLPPPPPPGTEQLPPPPAPAPQPTPQPAPGVQPAPSGPQSGLPDIRKFPTRPETDREKALDDVNEANQASFSAPVSALVNGAVRSMGLQPRYGLPECKVIAANKQADILVQFKHGPMPDSSAAALGLQACELLSRAYVVKGFGPQKVTVTVCYQTPQGRRYDYGTAIFQGNLDSIAWVAVGRLI